MNDFDYIPQKDPWFSPVTVISYFDLLRKKYGPAILTDHLFKKAKEMYSVAVTLYGIHELSEHDEYYMQINTQSSAPDVMTGKRSIDSDGKPIFPIVQAEVVEMELHSDTDDIVKFLIKTKLSTKKAYSNTVIICFVDKVIHINPFLVSKMIIDIAPKSHIYICGRKIDSKDGSYILFSPSPKLIMPIEFSINNPNKPFDLKPLIHLYRGIHNSLELVGKEDVNIYTALGLDKERIFIKYHSKKTTADR